MAIRLALRAALCALTVALALPVAVSAHGRPGPVGHRRPAPASIPRYRHIFAIVLENHNYEQIIGNPHAPAINSLAQRYGLATHYDGVTHPSEPNYVALIGGDYYGIQDDAPYSSTTGGVNHTIDQPSLADQLTAAGLSWKSYQQSLPYPGYMGVAYPADDPLYAAKHNPFLNFASVQREPQAELRRQIVPDTQFATDLRDNAAPAFSFITPDLCHDMHGGATSCPYADNADNPNDPNDIALVQAGDAYVSAVVGEITNSRTWREGNDAIVVTWDENDNFDNPSSPETTEGCCDAVPGGGRVPAIVIANHHRYGRGGLQDPTPYNHYALLRTIQTAFGLGCLRYTCDTAHVPLMAPLFANGRH